MLDVQLIGSFNETAVQRSARQGALRQWDTVHAALTMAPIR